MTQSKNKMTGFIVTSAFLLSVTAFGPSVRAQEPPAPPPPVPAPPVPGDPPPVPGPPVPGQPAPIPADPAPLPDGSARPKDVLGVALDTPRLSTLVSAIKAAGLEEALKGTGPYTVFAPANTAFRDVPQEALDKLMLPENKAQLAAFLKGHIVAGKYTRADLAKLEPNTELKTLAGTTIKISNNQGILIGAARPVQVDIPASNGVIHVIDTIIVPGRDATAPTAPTSPEGGAPPAPTTPPVNP